MLYLFTFSAEFTSEEACRLHFKEQRDKLGVTCQRLWHFRGTLDFED